MVRRSTTSKVYVPANARENQYVLATFKRNEELEAKVVALAKKVGANAANPIRFLRSVAFNACLKHGLTNVSFIAKDKLPSIRYSEEQRLVETEKQLIYFYNPKVNFGFHLAADRNNPSKKLSLLFLASGEDIRFNAAKFHHRVAMLLKDLADTLEMPLSDFKIRDHQHLTFDIFAGDKGDKSTITHGLRKMKQRYKEQSVDLPEDTSSIAFAVARMPITINLVESMKVDMADDQPYAKLYTQLQDKYEALCIKHGIRHAAFVANGKIPMVTKENETSAKIVGQMTHLSFSNKADGNNFISQVDNDTINEVVNLVCVAEQPTSEKNHAKFVNQALSVYKALAKDVGYQPENDAIVMRFRQHLSYSL